ncbi:MAG: SAM-dependent methyltransferase, partial [Cyanobacteria bacterium P01_H01_bin.130]
MARKPPSAATGSPFSSIGDRLPGMAKEIEAWEAQTKAVAGRFSKEYRGDTFDVPDEVQAMPIFQDW